MNVSRLLFLLVLINIIWINVYAQEPTNCNGAVIACGNSSINLDVSGVGIQELTGSNTCASQENNSVWLQVTLVTSGTLGFTLTPESPAITEDYDFFVFGPNASCSSIGQAIRCSTTNPLAAGQGNNRTGMNSNSFDTSEGPGPNGDSFVRWLNVSAGETYYIVIDRPIGNSAFNLVWTGSAQFASPPGDQSGLNQEVKNLESCDEVFPFDDGFSTFDLTVNTNLIIGNQNNTSVTYHRSESDANIQRNRIFGPYTNIRNPQTIYARITNNLTGCFDISEFRLDVNTGPRFVEPQDYQLCDNLDDGNDTNGQVIFDLTSRNTEILDGQDPSEFNITYHETEIGAESKSLLLPNSFYNTQPFNQVVFVRIEDITNPDCNSITSIDLVVNSNPIAFNANLLQCDEDGMVDGITLFNLSEANNALTGGLTGLSTKFYLDSARTIEINDTSYSNISNPQTIYTEVINDITECSDYSELIIEVSLTNSVDSELIECDNDGFEDGFFLFNLRNADTDVVNGLPTGLDIAYFETYNDALLEQNKLDDFFTNTIPYSQTIFSRVENNNNCYGISEVLLTVNVLPNIVTEDLIYYCLNKIPETITIDAAIVNDLPSNYSYNWSTGDTNYNIEINAIGTYTVDVINAYGCSKKRTITVEPSNTATFGVPPYNVEDVSQNNTVTVFVSGEGIYEYALYNENNTSVYKDFQESNVFENIFPGIYTINVIDIKNNCGIVDIPVSVIGFPKFFTPNNDNAHDTWQVYGISNMFQPNSIIAIYNRYGKLVKQLDPLGEGWDGTFNGEMLPSDDYWFAVTLQDGRVFKNHFTLKR